MSRLDGRANPNAVRYAIQPLHHLGVDVSNFQWQEWQEEEEDDSMEEDDDAKREEEDEE